MAHLEIKKVRKSYGSERHCVLRDVNLEIERGELVAILGPSGAGKTTLISLIAGLIRPDGGTIVFNEREVVDSGPDRGVVFQNYSLLPWLTARENVQLAVDQAFSGWSRSKRRDHVQKHLDMVKLGLAAHKRPHELSGGMRQRVAIARALALDPEMLLLDEPLSALDALTRAMLQDEIERIWRENRKTVLLVTNDVNEAILLADRVVPITAGPGATLRPAVKIDLSRPRDRKSISSLDRFKELHSQVIEALLSARSGGSTETGQAVERAFRGAEPVEAADLLTTPAPQLREREVMGSRS